MSERTLKRMVAVLGVLVLAWVVATIVGRDAPDPGAGGGEMAAFLESLAPEAATTIVFTGGDLATVRLEREPDGGWVTDGHPVDSAQAARFLSALADAGTGSPVSVNPSNHPRMEVDEGSTRVVALEGPEGVDTLFVGSSGPTPGTVYARLPRHDPVHVLSADLRGHARRSAADWRSRRIATVDTAAVAAVVVERGGDSYRIERSDSAWSVEGGATGGRAMGDMLESLVLLSAGGFVGEAEIAGAAAEPSRTITVRDREGGEMLVVRFWDPPEGTFDYQAVATGPAAFQPDERFRLPSFQVDRLTPPLEAVRAQDEGEVGGG